MTVRRIFSSVPARPSPSGRLRRRPLSRGFLAPAGLLRATPVHRASIRIRFPGYRSIISFSRSLSTTPLHIPCFSSRPSCLHFSSFAAPDKFHKFHEFQSFMTFAHSQVSCVSSCFSVSRLFTCLMCFTSPSSPTCPTCLTCPTCPARLTSCHISLVRFSGKVLAVYIRLKQ